MPGMLENKYAGQPVSVHHCNECVKNALASEYNDVRHMAMEDNAQWKQPVLHRERSVIFSKGPANSAYKAIRQKQRSAGTEIYY